MKRTQKGFSIVETLLLLLIVGLIGSVGWYVFNSSRKTNKINDSTASENTVSAQDQFPVVTIKDPVSYTDSSSTISFNHPADWTVKEYYQDLGGYESRTLSVIPPNAAKLYPDLDDLDTINITLNVSSQPASGIKSAIQAFKQESTSILATKSLDINGANGNYLRYDEPLHAGGEMSQIATRDYYAIYKGNNVVSVDFVEKVNRPDKNDNAFDESKLLPTVNAIVESFKILD